MKDEGLTGKENKMEMNEKMTNWFPEGRIVLLDGRVVDCYPRADFATEERARQPFAEASAKADKEEEADKERFIRNAFFFLAHKERILTDSRMFLCPVPILSGMSISGTSGFEEPTLGIYLQWWERCEGALRTDKRGCRSLLYKLSGSSLSGHNVCCEVREDGTTKCVELFPFKDYRDSFVSINNTYKSVKHRYQAYTLQQVLDILDHEEEGCCGYAHTINEQMQTREICVLNERVNLLKSHGDEQEQRIKELEKALYDERVLHYYDGYLSLLQRVTTETERLKQQKRDLKAALRRGDYTPLIYEQQVNAITQQVNAIEQELSDYKNRELLRRFPQPFWYIEDYAQQLRDRNNTVEQRENL